MAGNRYVALVRRSTGIPQAADFALREAAVGPLAEGGIRVCNRYLSVEPAMRGWIADTDNYTAPVPLGEPMRALAAGEIVESRDARWPVGTRVMGWFGWQECATVTAAAVLRRVPADGLDLSLSLGVLGINGVTASLALELVGRPKCGDTVLVSTAAGAVGSVVGQLAKAAGCHTVGIAGSAAKVALCRELYGFDESIDYHRADLAEAIAAACPDGIDVYFDNTGGPVSDAVLPQLAIGARVVVCGTAALARWRPWPQGPRVERHLLVKRAAMQGFVVFDHLDRWDETVAALAGRVRAGTLRYREDILDGLAAAPDAIAGLYRGENNGKRLIRL